MLGNHSDRQALKGTRSQAKEEVSDSTQRKSLRYVVWKCAGRPQHITFSCEPAKTARALNHRLQKGSGLLRRAARWPPDTKHYFFHVAGRRHGGAFRTANLSLLISVLGQLRQPSFLIGQALVNHKCCWWRVKHFHNTYLSWCESGGTKFC